MNTFGYIKKFLTPVANPIKLVFYGNKEFLHFFAAKLGHYIVNIFFRILQTLKPSLTAKIGKRRKKVL